MQDTDEDIQSNSVQSSWEDSEANNTARRKHRGTNNLNDLDTRDWLKATKSVWYSSVHDLEIPHLELVATALRNQFDDNVAQQVMDQILDSILVSRPPARDSLKAQHPATFAESDVSKLIRFFTKSGAKVLDPFLGSGSTLVACQSEGRSGTGIEVVEKWANVARQRIAQMPLFDQNDVKLEIVEGDARSVMANMEPASFDFIVTSPPYWSMLNKRPDHKVKRERLSKNLDTRYSNAADDLANLATYDEFLAALTAVFRLCARVLKPNKYIAVIVSDFRDGPIFHTYHADIAELLRDVHFQISGITILVQDSKTLYPYGMPHSFVSNIHHQYVVIAQKPVA